MRSYASHCGAHPHLHSDVRFPLPLEVSRRALVEELSCEVFPLGVLQVCPTEFPACFSPSLHFSVWNSFHCPCRVHSQLVREEMFIRFCDLSGPYSSDAFTAESWRYLDLELNTICARSHCDLVCQRPQRRFWINFQDCFRIRHSA